jgi:CelD/BcsL family acetyltransferase involved in cellulose biosynthesis
LKPNGTNNAQLTLLPNNQSAFYVQSNGVTTHTRKIIRANLVKVTVFTTEDVFQILEPEWNDLVKRSISNRIFSTWEWQSTWWSVYCPGELWVTTIRDDQDRLVGIAPWFIQVGPTGRVVRNIGCVEVTDYVDLIIDAQFTGPVFDVMAYHLIQNKHMYDGVDFCNISEDSPTRIAFPLALQQRGFNVRVEQQEVSPSIQLPGQWDEYLESLDRKYRHELRRKIRRMEATDEQVHWYIVDQSHDLETELETFLNLMASSQYNKARFLQDSQNARFFSAIVAIAHRNNWLQLCVLEINRQPAAGYLNFVYDDTVQVYNSGLLPDQFGHLSPGIVLLAYCIRRAIEYGYKTFDFLRGNETYKYHLGGKDKRLFTIKAKL